ncbi:NmrA family NAD(P)-binding protein [Patulibacter defluvii]|uniref:NmrA family NAD(P)-binding protein n=1 Tax=Patulibacter defluvii TaxID=3095358 RepID=UPI002A7625F3|nr:NmrA family NAD(P)-binding protein [Patulibacter sp. DM4]
MTSTTQPSSSAPVLVLGGTGKTGRRVAARLTARGVPARIGSRRGAPPFDWDDPRGWDAALAGVGAVYLSFQPDLAIPGTSALIERFVARAVAAGVDRIVLLSGRGEPEAERCEQVVRRSGLATTVVRCSWFAQNFSEDFLAQSVLDGEIVLPARDVPEPFVDVDDIADVAVAALIEPGHDGRLYELTGPRLLTFADVAAELTAATGREVRFRSVTAEDFTAALRAQGVPEEVIGMLIHLFAEVLDGRNAQVVDGVRQALGRPARDFRDYARDAAASGAWTLPAADDRERVA